MGGIRLEVLGKSSKRCDTYEIDKMKGIKNSFLLELKGNIEELSDENQKAILKILIEDDCMFTENANGVFFDLKTLKKEDIDKIKEYIKYCKDAEDNEKKRETEETELREELK